MREARGGEACVGERGAAIADLGMVGNETLTFLSLRDNSLKETAGLALEDSLRKRMNYSFWK